MENRGVAGLWPIIGAQLTATDLRHRIRDKKSLDRIYIDQGTIGQEFSKVAKIKNSITGSWRNAYYGSEGGFAREKSFSQRGF